MSAPGRSLEIFIMKFSFRLLTWFVAVLLTATPARDVEIVAHNLEDAFLALTGDEAPVGPGSTVGQSAA